MNKEIINQIKSSKSAGELKGLVNKIGYNLTDEDAKKYFDLYHGEGKTDDSELNNVIGGACTKWRRGRAYSGNYTNEKGEHYLIVFSSNSCRGFVRDRQRSYDNDDVACGHCIHYKSIEHGVIATLCCKLRTYENDPYNPK